MAAPAILTPEPLQDTVLEKQDVEVTHHDVVETTLTPKEQKKLM